MALRRRLLRLRRERALQLEALLLGCRRLGCRLGRCLVSRCLVSRCLVGRRRRLGHGLETRQARLELRLFLRLCLLLEPLELCLERRHLGRLRAAALRAALALLERGQSRLVRRLLLRVDLRHGLPRCTLGLLLRLLGRRHRCARLLRFGRACRRGGRQARPLALCRRRLRRQVALLRLRLDRLKLHLGARHRRLRHRLLLLHRHQQRSLLRLAMRHLPATPPVHERCDHPGPHQPPSDARQLAPRRTDRARVLGPPAPRARQLHATGALECGVGQERVPSLPLLVDLSFRLRLHRLRPLHGSLASLPRRELALLELCLHRR